MTPQQEAVALYRFLESRGFHPSVRSVGRTLRDQGLSFTDTMLRAWLSEFATQRRRSPTQKTSTNDAARRIPAAASRARSEVSLFSNSVESIDSTRSAPQRAEKAPKAQRLPFDRDLMDRKNEILAAVWRLVQPSIGSMTTVTEWRRRNSAVATDLARCKVPVEVIVRAWNRASNRLGEPVRMLRIVQDELSEAAAIVHGAKIRAQA